MLPFDLPLGAPVDFLLLGVAPCLPIVGRGTGLVDLALVPAIFGGGTLGGTANVNGVLAGVADGVGDRPSEGFTASCRLGRFSRGLRNMIVRRLLLHILACGRREVMDGRKRQTKAGKHDLVKA